MDQRDLELAKELEILCAQAGARQDWVQAAGGNASIKDEKNNALLIKASGLRLREVTRQQGMVKLPLSRVRQMLEDSSYQALGHAQQQDRAGKEMSALLTEGSARPSLETGFHALGARVVLHTHPVAVLPFLSLIDGKQRLAAILDEPFAWVDYRPPGHSLACLVMTALKEQAGCKLVFLKHHGLIVYAENIQEAFSFTENVVSQCAAALPIPAQPPRPQAKFYRKQLDTFPAELTGFLGLAEPSTRWAQNVWAQSLANPESLSWKPLCPDDVIYCGPSVPQLSLDEIENQGHLRKFLSQGSGKAVLAVSGVGTLLAAGQTKSLDFMEEMLAANCQARAVAQALPGFECLEGEQVIDLLGMEGEKYRQKLMG